jgi:SAM-dependent methyltransferase
MEENPVSAGYDAVFGAYEGSATLRRLWRTHASGEDFPPEFDHISFVTVPQLRRFVSELRLSAGQTLVDVGCGMAGPALWLARETGAKLVGVDLSPVAVKLATARAERLGIEARFANGSFADTGLEDGVADGVTSEDAIQYAPDKGAVFKELARITRPGGRLVFAAFELEPERVAGLPVLGVDPVADYRPLLDGAGFSVEVYEEVPGWLDTVTAAYGAVAEARDELVGEMGEGATNALMGEIVLTLQVRPYRSRVFVSAARR